MKYLNTFCCLILILVIAGCSSRITGLKKSDIKKDVLMVTDKGSIVLRLSDSTPLHRDNFLRLVKSGFYDGIGFHRVIKGFMVQAGDVKTKPGADTTKPGNYMIPAEFRSSLFHHKGALAAARRGDNVNPEKMSSATQFYIVHGTVFTDRSLDSTSAFRMNGYKFPEQHRNVYKNIGGAPHLDQQYTVFGEVIQGLPVVDSIASVNTSGKSGGDKPLSDVRIIKTRLIKRN